MVYTMIGLTGLGVGAAAYFGFTLSPIESVLTAVMVVVVAVLAMERQLRRRAEIRLEQAIEELSALLSTDAQAGAVLGQRVNALVEADPSRRIEGLEADISVLGTVVRQVAEAVADLEAGQSEPAPQPEPLSAAADGDRMEVLPFQTVIQPKMAPDRLRRALEEGRLVCHLQPIVSLPQRRPQAFDLVPRLLMEGGELVESDEFMPGEGAASLVHRIDSIATREAIAIVKRVRAIGQPLPIHVPISRPTLSDRHALDRMVSLLDADRAVAANLVFVVEQTIWQGLSGSEEAALDSIIDMGAGVSLGAASSLRCDYAGLAARGVRSVRVDAGSFLAEPTRFTDFLSSDIAAYVRRFGVDIIFTGIENEQQIITLLEDGLTTVSGPHIARPGPMRPDLLIDRAGPVVAPAGAPRRAGL